MRHVTGHEAPTSCVCVSPSGDGYASGSYDHSILIWDIHAPAPVRRLAGHTGLINGVDWSSDGHFLASGSSDHTARVWDLRSGREWAQLRGHTDDVNVVRFSPSSMRVATASFDGTVRIWTLDGRCLLVAAHHASDVNGLRWLPDGRRLAAASDDGTVSVFDEDGGRIRRLFGGHGDWVDDVAVHPSGAVLASACLDGKVTLFDVETGRKLRELTDARCVVKAVAFSPDGSELAAAAYDGCVRVYETQRYSLLRVLRHEGLWNRTLEWSPRGWVTGSFAGGPALLHPDGVRQLGPAPSHGINSFTLAPHGRALVCSDDGRVYEVDLETRRSLGEVARHEAAVLCAAVSADGLRLATGSWDRRVAIWDRRSGEQLAEWPGLGDPINAVAFDPSSSSVVAGTFNGDVVRWDPESGAVRFLGRQHGSVKALSVTKDGVTSVGRDGMVHQHVRGADGGFRAGHTILNDVAACGSRLATASRRDGIQLWGRDGEALGAFRGHPCSTKSVTFTADGRRVAAAYYDGHVALWDPATNSAQVTQVSGASLSKIAAHGNELVVSAWDAEGSLLLLDPDTETVDRVSVAA